MSSTDPVQQQLEAYNAHDVDAFLACYADDVVVRHGDGRELISGRDAMRDVYAGQFEAHPDLHADVASRIQAADWVVDEERVSMGGAEQHALVGYQVRDGLIRHVVMLAPMP